ncbi:ABC transporter permease [Desulfosporosinus sp. PR]|uniref:ABC transporter permease n=1 Tax=Candidatus Desulfosporosinus nitrosoreducens TaxID=3401928 RepID=UPI0027F20ACC|nr:ABC transporter permease [Desulfosporosinus sp. PR]MDQ7097034.1 ABC transporter permease [Desulfosporosinus sp. PR]
MYIFKNALKSMSRSKGRNVLIGIIVLVIAVASCVALSIRNSANEIVANQKASFDITATIGLDRSALMKQAQSSGTNMQDLSLPDALTLTELKNYADSQYVKSLTYSLTTSMNSSDITAVSNNTSSGSSSNTTSTTSKAAGGAAMPSMASFVNKSQGDFRVIGYSSTSAMSDFVNGTYKITSGSMFSDSDTTNAAVISDELAQANNLTVGSKFTLTNPNDSTQADEFTVTGIYTDTSSSDGSQMNLFSNAANQIITDYTAVNNIVTASAANDDTKLNSQLTSSFSLKSADDVAAFKAELTAKGLNQDYTVSTNADSFTQSVAPLNNLSHFATIFLVLVLGIGAIVLVVLNMINIRERKYEVGVLRAIGMKKGKVALQFIAELFMVTFLALGIGAGIGAAASVPTANYMLQNEISTTQAQQSQVQQNFGRSDGGNAAVQGGGGSIGGFFGTAKSASYVNQINAVIDGQVLLEIAGIGILLVLLSSGMSMIFISRYEPLKILSNLS